MAFKYREDVLAELSKHGVSPDETCAPELVREYVNSLYVHEIRTLRDRMRRGLIPRSEYSSRVRNLRDRYPILGLPCRFWLES